MISEEELLLRQRLVSLVKEAEMIALELSNLSYPVELEALYRELSNYLYYEEKQGLIKL